MAGDKTKKDGRDRDAIAGGKDYEVDYLIRKIGISRSQAIGLLHRFGNDRKTLEEEAKKLLR